MFSWNSKKRHTFKPAQTGSSQILRMIFFWSGHRRWELEVQIQFDHKTTNHDLTAPRWTAIQKSMQQQIENQGSRDGIFWLSRNFINWMDSPGSVLPDLKKNPCLLNFFQHCVQICRCFPWLILDLYFQCSCCQKYRMYWQMLYTKIV